MEPTESLAMSVARAFASALDTEDFDRVRSLIHADCLYDSPGGMIRGADRILDTYRDNAAWAKQTLDHIRYESEATPLDSCSAWVLFTDVVTHRGQGHTYHCRQLVSVNADGLIVRISHQELPGERQALEAYWRSVGLRR